jgi:hypothetical protein
LEKASQVGDEVAFGCASRCVAMEYTLFGINVAAWRIVGVKRALNLDLIVTDVLIRDTTSFEFGKDANV